MHFYILMRDVFHLRYAPAWMVRVLSLVFLCIHIFNLLQSEINTLHTFSQSFTCLVSIFTVPFLRPPDNPSSSWYIRTTWHSWVRSFPGFFFLSWDVKESSQHLQPASCFPKVLQQMSLEIFVLLHMTEELCTSLHAVSVSRALR